MKEIVRESFSFKSGEEERGKVVTMYGNDGKKEKFKFSCGEQDRIIVSQKLDDIWIKWDTTSQNGNPMDLKDILNFLSQQGYNRRNIKKGGNDK